MPGPLDGLFVIDLSRVLAGPYASMILADLGAEVLKIEHPEIGDEARSFGPFQKGVSAYFMSINRGKKSMTLDLRSNEGKEILKQLVCDADILIENFRPGVMKRLELDYETLKELNPRLIYSAISGFGQTGPWASKGAYDMIIQGLGGIISITGEPDQSPIRVGTSISDLAGAMFSVTGILAALQYRERTGEGQFVDVAMLDSLTALLENAVARYTVTGQVPGRLGSRHPAITPFQVFPSKDGYLILAIGNDTMWIKFCKCVRRDDLASNPLFKTNHDRTENHDKLEPFLNELFLQKSTQSWIDKLEQEGIPCGPIQSIDQLINHPQIQAREMITEIDHPVAGPLLMPGSPIKLSKTPSKVDTPAPQLGEHTERILQDRLGLKEEEIRGLREKKII